MRTFVTYLLIINAAAFLIMLIDKLLARAGAWRVPEMVLLGLAACGGSAGCLLAMYTVRHKTLHPQFTIGVPAMLMVQVAAWFLLR